MNIEAGKRPSASVTPFNFVVLVVEDNAQVLDAIQQLLTLEGFVVLSASGIEEALKHLRTYPFQPDLILTDYHLTAGENGHDLIRQIRRACSRAIPAIVLSADDSPERIRQTLAYGYYSLLKPVDMDLLLATIGKLLRPPTV